MTTGAQTGHGVQFRAVDGRRSSQTAGKSVFSDAAASVDASLAAKIDRQKEWRKAYLGPVRALVEAGARSGKDAVRIASDGLRAVHENLVFRRGDDERPLLDAIAGGGNGFETATIEGAGTRVSTVVVPYRGVDLSGDALARQLDAWTEAGVIEESCAAAVADVAAHPEWLDLSDMTFALLGAGAEMGPLESLCGWGANVLALDLPRPELWERIGGVARSGGGRVSFPRAAGGSPPGIDFLTQTPEALAWLRSFDGSLVAGNYAYSDGSNFLRLAGALDALTVGLQRERPGISIAYLATPTDVFAVPESVVERSHARPAGRLSGAARAVTFGRMFSPNYPGIVAGENGRRWGIADSLVPQQGPNYALAKMLQRWRAVVAREEGTVTSANVAPATRTRSVVKNRVLALAYRGAGAFGVEVFEPATSRALMAALLVHDLRNPAAPANPETHLDHPFDLFVDAAAHGGLWTLAYAPRSVLPLAAGIGLVRRGAAS
ncbi:MAG: hypothetical protein M3273_03715 [Actinomycetota bacterium]|nr:hypothetical protein [Actinomycetota bacterium]